MDTIPAVPITVRSDKTQVRLLVAAHFVYAGRVGGAEQMLYNLLRGLAHFEADTVVLCSDVANLDNAFRAELATLPRLTLRQLGGRGPRFVAEQRACLAGGLSAEATLFPNYYLPPVLPRRLGRTGIVLHDLQHRHFPAYFSARKRAWLRAAQSFAVSRADRVFVISDFVGRDVLRVHGEHLRDKLVVAPNPISWDRFVGKGGEETRPLERPYVLSVAAQYAHKNLVTLIRGFAELAARDHDVQLVLCGQTQATLHGVGGVKVSLAEVIEELGLAGRVKMTGYLDDAALGRWYRHAALFAFPSLFEGFGMPPVEALGFGLPVLTTDRTALPETTLGLAGVVDEPERPSAWASRMAEVLRQGDAARLAPEIASSVRETYSPVTCAARYYQALCG